MEGEGFSVGVIGREGKSQQGEMEGRTGICIRLVPFSRLGSHYL